MTKLDKKVADTELLSLETKGFYFVYKYLLETYGKDINKILEELEEYNCLKKIEMIKHATYIDSFQYEYAYRYDDITNPEEQCEFIDIKWFLESFNK